MKNCLPPVVLKENAGHEQLSFPIIERFLQYTFTKEDSFVWILEHIWGTLEGLLNDSFENKIVCGFSEAL